MSLFSPLLLILLQAGAFLELGQPRESSLQAGETQGWKLALAEDDYIELRVDQIDGEIGARLIDPSGRLAAEFDSVIGALGSEQIHWLVTRGGEGDWLLEVAATAAGPARRYRVEWTVRRPPSGGDRRRLEAESLERKARRLRAENQRQEAARTLAQALRIRERAFGREHPGVVPVLLEISGLLIEGRNAGQAEPFLRRAVEILRRDRAAAAELSEALNQLALSLNLQDKHKEAAAALEEAVVLVKDRPEGGRALAGMLNNLAIIYRSLEDLDQAERVSRDALEIRRELLSHEHPDLAQSYLNLGVLARERGVLPEALALTSQALDLFRDSLGDGHPEVLRCRQHLAAIQIESGKFEEAVRTLSSALENAETLHGPFHREVAGILRERAQALRALDRLNSAREDLERAQAILETLLGPGHSLLGEVLRELGVQAISEGSFEVAEDSLRRSVTTLEKSLGPGHPETAHSLLDLADCLLRQGRRTEARSALSLARHIAVHEPLPWPLLRGILGLAVEAAGTEEALREAARELRLLELNMPPPDWPDRSGHWLDWESRQEEWSARVLELTHRFEGEEAARNLQQERARYRAYLARLETGERRFEGLPAEQRRQFRERARELRERRRRLQARSAALPVPMLPLDDLVPVLDLLLAQGDLIRDEIQARDAASRQGSGEPGGRASAENGKKLPHPATPGPARFPGPEGKS